MSAVCLSGCLLYAVATYLVKLTTTADQLRDRLISRCWTEGAENTHPSRLTDCWLTDWLNDVSIVVPPPPNYYWLSCLSTREGSRGVTANACMHGISLVYGVDRHQGLIVLFCACQSDAWRTRNRITDWVILIPICSQQPTNCAVCRYCTRARWEKTAGSPTVAGQGKLISALNVFVIR